MCSIVETLVDGIRVRVGINKAVMGPVIHGPLQNGVLKGSASEESVPPFDKFIRVVRAVRKQSVVTAGDTHSGREIEKQA